MGLALDAPPRMWLVRRLAHWPTLAMFALLGVGGCTTTSTLVRTDGDTEFVHYSGSITLRGTYALDPENIETDGLVCFVPDAESRKRIPRKPNEVLGSDLLCFSNDGEARELLGLAGVEGSDPYCRYGPAVITIDRYSRYIAESEGTGSARLLRVHRYEAASVVSCSTFHDRF